MRPTLPCSFSNTCECLYVCVYVCVCVWLHDIIILHPFHCTGRISCAPCSVFPPLNSAARTWFPELERYHSRRWRQRSLVVTPRVRGLQGKVTISIVRETYVAPIVLRILPCIVFIMFSSSFYSGTPFITCPSPNTPAHSLDRHHSSVLSSQLAASSSFHCVYDLFHSTVSFHCVYYLFTALCCSMACNICSLHCVVSMRVTFFHCTV